LEYGDAALIVYIGSYDFDEAHQRVICVPLYVPSGKVRVEGPEESGIGRELAVAPGHYRVCAAQKLASNGDAEVIELFFEPLAAPQQRSEIIVADEELEPPETLVEETEVAGA
jgi:hypothetical protein